MEKRQVFDALIELVKFDTAVRLQRNSLENYIREEKHFEQERGALEGQVLALKNEVTKAKKHVDAIELAIAQMNEEEKSKRIRLDSMSEYKEYKALKSEIDHLHEQQKEYEEQVVTAWNTFEEITKRYQKEQESVQKKVELINNKIEQCKKECQKLILEIEECLKKRPEKELSVPVDLIAKYSLMKERVNDPVVALENGSCSVCFYQLTPTDVHMVKKGMLVQCKNCFRLLYAKDVVSDVHGA